MADKLLATAIARLERLKKAEAFDPFHLDSRPTSQQDDIFKAINDVQFRYVRAGNRCLAKGTLVATDKGPTPIEDIQIGDTVYDENGNPIKVKQTFQNGIKEVVEITNRNQVWAESTLDHVWQMISARGKIKELPVSDFCRDDLITRQEVSAPLGNETCSYAYALGALLGDGCSRQGSGNIIFISSQNEEVVRKVASQLGGEYKKCPSDNYNWKIYADSPALYTAWCKGRYAHEKLTDLSVIKQWDRDTLLEFVAGLIDTDGSVYVNQYDNVCIQFGMQAKSVVEAMQYAIMALWNTPTQLYEDVREKYVNGNVWYIRVGTNALSPRILKELTPKLKVDSKMWKPEYEDYVAKRSRSDAVGWKLGSRRLIETYDIHVDSSKNLYCLANGLVTHNSGKSALAARELTWILQGEHPYWTRPESWGTAPITALVVGKSRQGIETELWGNKIRPFLYDTWKEVRSGNVLQSVENPKTGDKIIFLTHADSSDRVIDNLQMYTAHYVWLDEMPRKLRVLEELQNRVSTTNGPFIATFTPKVVNIEVKNFVDTARPPVGKRYPLARLNNPVFADSKDVELQKLEGLPNSLKKAILDGDWMVGAEAVFDVDVDKLVVELPKGYHKGWRHVESVDPGSRNTGYTLWAEDPDTDIWYCILATYIEEVRDPAQLFQQVQNYSRGYNVVRRVCDPASTWYIGHASAQRVSYVWPYAKNQSRNEELLKGLQSAITEGKIKLTHSCSILLEELSNAMWNDSGSKIVNHHKYHTIDCAKYFVDCIPKPNKTQLQATPHQWIYEQNEKRKKMDAAKAAKLEAKILRRRRKVWR